MDIIFTINNCCEKYQLIEILKPVRGEGGTLAYTARVDGILRTFEMNDDCIWESEGVAKDLCQCIGRLITQYKLDGIKP